MRLERWEIDSGHSGIFFSIRHMALAKVRGQFTRWAGSLTAEEGDLRCASVDILIDASSISTGLEDRDAHLKSADFLHTAAFPEITFQGRACSHLRGRKLKLDGELCVLGRSHPMALHVENTGRTIDPWGRERASFSAKGCLERKAFGITWNRPLGAFGFLVGDQVEFEVEVEAVLQEEIGTEGRPARQGAADQLPFRPGMGSGRSKTSRTGETK
ncbi:MAG: YceI family protein [Holophaga sp.]|nr:YceI family protein [Holophaga sp.]